MSSEPSSVEASVDAESSLDPQPQQQPPAALSVTAPDDDEAASNSASSPTALAPLPSPASPTPPPRPNKGSLRAGGGLPSPLSSGSMLRSASQSAAEPDSANADSVPPLSPSIDRASSASVSAAAASAPRPAIPPRPINTARHRGSSAAPTPHSATAASSSASAAAVARSHRLHPPAPITEPSSPTSPSASKDDDPRPVFDRFRSFLKRMTVSSDSAPPAAVAGWAANKTAYTQMLFLLQHEPRYLSTLARLLQPRGDSIPQFVQTVVFDIFGESTGTLTAASAFASAGAVGVQQLCAEERMLLRLLKCTLFTEMQTCTDRATLLRSNSALTQMLSAYAKRSEGAVILRRILQEPLMQICEAPELKNANLELQPLKIHNQLIATWAEAQEAVQDDAPTPAPVTEEGAEGEDGSAAPAAAIPAPKTGCPFDASVSTDAEALAVPFVAAVIESRVNLLVHCCDLVMDRILESADVIPVGMRWIVRIMAELYRERFAHTNMSPAASSMSAATAAAASSAASALPPPALLGSLPESIAEEHPESEASESTSAASTATSTATSSSAASSPSVSSAAPVSRVQFDSAGLPLSPSSRSSLSSEIQSLQGGYLMLRFFNPAIVAPEGSKLVVSRPSKQLQRNLVLIAKVLQNLSNGVEFGGKESYMACVNSYITAKAPRVKDFFRKLEDVDDLEPETRALTAAEYKTATAAAAAAAAAAASAEAATVAASSSAALPAAASAFSSSAASASALVPPPVGARATLSFHLAPRVGAVLRIPLGHLYALHATLLAHQDHLCFSPAFPLDDDDDDPLAVLLARIPPPPPASSAASTAAGGAALSVKDKEKLAEVVVMKLTDAEVNLVPAMGSDAAAAAAAAAASPRDRSASAIVPSSSPQKTDAAASSAAAPAPAGGGVLTQAKSIFSTAMRKLKM